MKVNTNPARGMRDFLPQEHAIREYVEKTIVNLYKQNGFELIETPVVENIDNLMGSQGGENLNLIFKILKRGNKLNLQQENLTEEDIVEFGLRYDLTVPLSRFYCNNKSRLPTVFKAIQVGNVFRAERAQKGRYRSFKQCDIDIIGDGTCNAEIELLTASAGALTALGVKDFQIRINDRRILNAVITGSGFPTSDIGSICIILDKLDKIGLDGVEKELLANDYAKDAVTKITQALKTMGQDHLDHLMTYPLDHNIVDEMKKIINTVNDLSGGAYDIVYDFSLIRGMGYYTGPIFEIVYKDLGYSIAGGGRYDKMIGEFIGQDIPAVGFSIGFERLVNQLIDENYLIEGPKRIAVLYDSADDFKEVMTYANQLRSQGSIVLTSLKPKKMAKYLNQLSDSGYQFFTQKTDDQWEIKPIS